MDFYLSLSLSLSAVWFEFTPHEAGFPELGHFVSTAYLGSGFEGGELKERKPEMDMVQLLGYFPG